MSSEPSCPICSSEMVLRTARRGSNAGNQFWGCSQYPQCKGTIDLDSNKQKQPESTNDANAKLDNQKRKVVWYDNFSRKGYNSEYVTLGSTPLFLGDFNLASINGAKSQFNLLSKKVPPTSSDDQTLYLGAILQKLLARGDLPYCSLGIEAALAAQKDIKKFIKKFDAKSPIIGWHWDADTPFDMMGEINLSQRRRALTEADKGVVKRNSKGIFDSPLEEKFFIEWISNNFGVSSLHWFTPQAPLDRLINTDDDELTARRVDFLFYHPASAPLVIELDGEEHLETEASDTLRDARLEQNGISVVRIQNEELHLGDGENLKKAKSLIANALDKITPPKSSPIYKAIKLSSVASSFQFILAKALSNGRLDLNAKSWKIHVAHDLITQQVLSAAADDFAEMLSALRALYFKANKQFKIELFFEKPKKPDLVVGLFVDESPLTLDCTTADYDFICCAASLPADVTTNVSTTSSQHKANDLELSKATDLLTIFLQNLFRKRKFRELQDLSVLNVLRRKDTVTLLPTGAGKSIIYQLAGLLQPGITLVIDPIVALIEDQILGLASVGIDKASAAPTGFNNIKGRQAWLRSIEQGESQFILISPERLQMTDFRETLRALVELNHINLAVIDEAHCVSEWGHNFRFSYLNLADNLRKFCTSPDGVPPTLLALTGTASRAVLRELLVELNISKDDDEALIRPVDFDRKELKFNISKVAHGGDTSAVLRGILNSLPNRFNQPPSDFFKPSGKDTNSGIVFTPFVNGRTHGLFAVKSAIKKNVSAPVTTFSGSAPRGTDKANWELEKRQNARDFKENRAPILVATKAFGMGIDKPNIRWTLHMGMPSSMEAFYQEAGRAGRDKNLAICNVIFSEADTDQTDNALSGEGNLIDLRDAATKLKKNDDDVSRALFFHLNAFSGTAEEYDSVSTVLGLIGNLDERKKVELTFDNDSRSELERSLLRLKKCGIVEDLEVNYGSKNIVVSVRPFHFDTSRKIIEEYIRESQPARLRSIMNKLDTIETINHSAQPQNLCNLMIDFTYDVIERSRRRMLYEAILLGRNYSDDEEIRQYLLDYLQEGLGAEKIAQLAEESSINFEEWLELFAKISTPMEAGEIRGIAIRLLETYPDHPGMLLLRGVSETLVQKNDDLLVRNSITTALANATDRYDCTDDQLKSLLLQLIDFASSRSHNLRVPLISAIRHTARNFDYVDDEVSKKLSYSSQTWDEASRMAVLASEMEVKLPQLLHLATQRITHHKEFLSRGR